MKLRNYINPELVKNSESITPMFGLTQERWDELGEAIIAFFDAGGKMSETFERFDEYAELKDEKEVIAVMYMFGVEKGRFEGEEISRDNGIESVKVGRIHRIMESAQWFKDRGIALTEYLKRFMDQVKILNIPGVTITSGRGIESLIATILKEVMRSRGRDILSQFSNKNKFKKDNFDIPDPNKKPGPEGDESNKES